jgi:tetratricopeptide (TPR) repeat protein
MLTITPKGTIKYNNKILKFNPDFIKSWYEKGTAFSFEKKYEEAIECYDEILKRDSSCFSAIRDKGQCFAQIRDFKKAVECYDKCTELEPENYYIYSLKARALYEIGESEKAMETTDKLLSIFPNSTSLLFDKAMLLSLIYEDYESSLKIYNKIINTPLNMRDPLYKNVPNLTTYLDLSDYKTDAYFNKGTCLLEMGDLKGAYYSKMEGLKLRPNDANQIAYCGEICYKLKCYDKSEELLLKSFEYDLEILTAWYLLGRICEKEDRYEEAINYYKLILDRDSACDIAKKKIEALK